MVCHYHHLMYTCMYPTRDTVHGATVRLCTVRMYKMADLDCSERTQHDFLLHKVQEASSGIVREFWRGKLAQLSTPFSTGEEAVVCHETCLSPSVHALLTRPLVPLSRQEGGPFLGDCLTLNWEEVGAHIAKGK